MDTVGLHHRLMLVHVQQEEREQANVILAGQSRVHGRKLPDVFRTVIRRQRDSGEDERQLRRLQTLDEAGEIALSFFDRQST